MMKTKLIAIITLILVLSISLFLCNKNPNSGGTSFDEELRIVVSAENTGLAVSEIQEAFLNCTGKVFKMSFDTTEKIGREIVLGDSNRAITEKANEMLSKYLDRLEEDWENDWENNGKNIAFLVGYAVYSDGESLALVWSDPLAKKYALEYFLNNYCNTEALTLQSGYIDVQPLDKIELLREIEDSEREVVYEGIAAEYGSGVVDALKHYLSIFDDKYYYWLASLYDPGLYDENGNALGGGFYYSSSARNNDGFGVDLESTWQALSWVINDSGMFSSAEEAKAVLPESMLNELAAFALSCQSSTDGYFYHPQWGTNIQTSRKGRDLGYGAQILPYCGVLPYWNTPNGDKGYYGNPDGDDSKKNITVEEYRNLMKSVSTASSLTYQLSHSPATAVSKVVVQTSASGNKWSGSSWLSTLGEWETYLQGYASQINSSSYNVGNNFSSQSSQIKARDTLAIKNKELSDVRDINGNPGADGIADGGYIELFKKYFDSWQYDNGLWEKCSLEDGTVYYNAINGLMKITSCYDSLRIPMSKAQEAFKSAIFVVTYFGNGSITGDDAVDWADSKGKAPTDSVDIYNPWVAMDHILSIVSRMSTREEVEELRSIVNENAEEMIRSTLKKVMKFAKADGSYGYTWTTVPSKSQGALVAVSGKIEGDINGGNIATTGIFNEMLRVLGITSDLKPYAYSDGLVFAEYIKELGPIVKTNEDLELLNKKTTFDDAEAGYTVDMLPDVSQKLTTGSIVVVENEADSTNKHLKFTTVNGGGDYLMFSTKQKNGATGAVLEWKMKFDPITKANGVDYQITLGNSYLLTLSLNTDGTFKLGDASSKNSGSISNSFDGVYDAYSWNTIRVEYYLIDASANKAVTHIYVNGILRAASTNYWDKQIDAQPVVDYNTATFFALKTAEFTVYFDDVYAAQTADEYIDKPIYNPDLVKDFEGLGSENLPSGVTTSGGSVVNAPTSETPDNNALLLDANGEDVTVSVDGSYAIPNCYVFNTKMKIESSNFGDIATLTFAGSSLEKALLAFKLTVYEENGQKYAKLTEYDRSGNEGKSYVGLPLDQWFDLKIEFYPYFYETDACTVVYCDGTELGRGNKVFFVGNLSEEYTTLVLEMTAAANLYIDDVTVDRISKSYVSNQGVTVPDPEVSLPIAIAKKDESISFNTSVLSNTPNCFTVTTDVMIEASAVGQIADLIITGTDTSKIIMAYHVEIYEVSGRKYAKLTEFDKNGNLGNSYTGVPVGQWFTLTLDFYPYFYQSDACAVVYMNGKEIGRGITYYHISTLSVSFSKFIATMTSSNAALYFKNTSVAATEKPFVDMNGNTVKDPNVKLPSSGVGSSTPPETNHNGRFDFENAELGTPSVSGLTTTVNTKEYGYWLDVRSDPKNAANKVLTHIVVPTSLRTGNKATYSASKLSPEGANCYVFEFDVLIGESTAGEVQTAFNGIITKPDGTTQAVSLFQTNIYFRGNMEEGTVRLLSKRNEAASLNSYLDPNAEATVSNNGTEIVPTVDVDGWLNIRFELYTDKNLVQVYYDDEFKGETDLVYTHQMSALLTDASVYTTFGANCELYFDNIIVEAIDKEYTEKTVVKPSDGRESGAYYNDASISSSVKYDFNDIGSVTTDNILHSGTVYGNQIEDGAWSFTQRSKFALINSGLKTGTKYVFETDFYMASATSSIASEQIGWLGMSSNMGKDTQFLAFGLYYTADSNGAVKSVDLKDANGTVVATLTTDKWHNISIEYTPINEYTGEVAVYLDGEKQITYTAKGYGNKGTVSNASYECLSVELRSAARIGFTPNIKFDNTIITALES